MIANIHRIQRNRELNGERGFTLIELLIVIVVLGILAAIVVFALGGVTGSSAAAACTTDAQTVAVAIAAEQAATPGTPALYATGTAAGDLAPAYIASLPSNPAYTISMVASPAYTVQVALASTDPGATTPSGAASGPTTVAQNYNSSGSATVYKYPAGWSAPELNNGICAGA